MIGVASWVWVRPILMMSFHACALSLSALRSFCSAGISRCTVSSAAAMCIAVGKQSFDDWLMLTWLLGWTGVFEPISPPRISIARFEITSLAFMFDCVPEPVCQTTSGKCWSSLPSITSFAALTIASPSLRVEPAEAHVGLRRGALDDAERPHDRLGHALAADREVLDRALGLRAPVAVGRNVDRSEGVGLDAHLGLPVDAWLEMRTLAHDAVPPFSSRIGGDV